MINLLPEETKRDIRAARTNVILLRYCVISFATLLVVLGFCLAFYIFLGISKSSAKTTSEENRQTVATLSDVMTKANAYKKDLATAKTIFGESIRFSDIIFDITELLPAGVVLGQVNISYDDFGKPILFSAHATSYDKAAKLKENFQNSGMFTNVFLQNVSNADSSSEDASANQGPYPVNFTISAELKEGVGAW